MSGGSGKNPMVNESLSAAGVREEVRCYLVMLDVLY